MILTLVLAVAFGAIFAAIIETARYFLYTRNKSIVQQVCGAARFYSFMTYTFLGSFSMAVANAIIERWL